MASAIRQAAWQAQAAGEEAQHAAQDADNAANWATAIMSEIYPVITGLKKQGFINFSFKLPLGDNVAHLFGKEHLEVNGQPVILKGEFTLELPK